MKTPIREWLDSEDFDYVAYSYRSVPVNSPPRVVEKFENLKDAIEAKFNELAGEKNE